MARKSDSTPKPRPSRGRSGKPAGPPVETEAGTPGFGEAPQAAFTATGPLRQTLPATSPAGESDGGSIDDVIQRLRDIGGGAVSSAPSRGVGMAPPKPLPALRGGGPLPGPSGSELSATLDALLARPEQRSEKARALLLRQPMIAEHPLVAGTLQEFVPHRPPRPDKSEGGIRFEIVSEFEPRGDQPQAIKELVEGIATHERNQMLLGVTGSGKTFTMAHVIARAKRPALILDPNKTLAAQLYGEMKSFFPRNAVEYFVSTVLAAHPRPTPCRTPSRHSSISPKPGDSEIAPTDRTQIGRAHV